MLLGAVAGFLAGKGSSAPEALAKASQQELKTRGSLRQETATGSSSKRATRSRDMAEISRLPGSSARLQAMIGYYSDLTAEQLEQEAKQLDNMPINERILASFLLFGRWAEVDPTTAMAFTNTMGFTGGFVRPTVLQSWASTDPASAAKYLADNPREFAMMGMMGGGRGGMGMAPASIIAAEWAKQDPEGALAWAKGLGDDKASATASIIGEIAKTDPEKAAEMLRTSGDTDDRGYELVAAQYGAKDFSAAQAWIRTLPADQQDAALAAAIRGLSNNDPDGAALEVARMDAGDAKDDAVREVVDDLARLDPEAAGAFLLKQGSENAQRDAMRELMPTWVTQDSAAALAFANSLTGTVRDQALQSYVFSNNSSDPKDIVKVAETIENKGDMERSMSMAVGRWMREDADSAKAYVQASTLLEEESKQRIIEGRGMWGGGRGRGR